MQVPQPQRHWWQKPGWWIGLGCLGCLGLPAALGILGTFVALVTGTSGSSHPQVADRSSLEDKQTEPRNEDIQIDFIESKPTSEGTTSKFVVRNVGGTPARVAMWPYVTLTDGKRLGRSLTEGPVFADIEPGKQTVVWGAVRMTERERSFISSVGVEDVTVDVLEGVPSTPQTPGRTRHSGISKTDTGKAAKGDAYAIVPGKSLGPIHLGMAVEDAMAAGSRAWGEDVEMNDTLGVNMSWPKTHVVANADAKPGEKPRVFSIRTDSPRFRLKGNVAVGNSYRSAQASLGRPSYYDKMEGVGARAAWSSGIWLDHDPSGKIAAIGVDFNRGLLLFR